MKRFGMLFIFGIFTLTSYAQQQKPLNGSGKIINKASGQRGNLRVFAQELAILEGQWMGTLTYLDYQSGKPYTMEANILVNQSNKGSDTFHLRYEYPGEPKANSTSAVIISDEGKMLNGGKVVQKKHEGGKLLIITENNGEDDDKKALIRYTYTATTHSFTLRKEVKFEGTAQFIERNVYIQSR